MKTTTDIKAFFAANPEEDVSSGSPEAMDRYMEQLAADHERAAALAHEQGIPYISAVVIAKDITSGERSKRWTEKGLDARVAMGFVGSFARLDFALWAVEAGHLQRSYLIEVLPGLWRGSDPDDTDPRFLALWREAKAANGGRMVTDLDAGEVPPWRLMGKTVTVWRGELGSHPPKGIAWTLDRSIARKFAKTGGLRGAIDLGGTMHKRTIPTSAILGYLAHRGEAEVVIDPDAL